MISPLGVRGATRSDSAMKAATTKAAVVNRPNVFWMRVTELYMLGAGGPCGVGFLDRGVSREALFEWEKYGKIKPGRGKKRRWKVRSSSPLGILVVVRA